MQFVKQQRLQATRTMLLAADPKTTTITDMAAQYGFWYVGRFSNEYRQLFHESPVETLRR